VTLTAAPASSHDPALAQAFDAARQLCRRHAPGLYLASQFLPPHKRAATWAVLAMRQMIWEAIHLPQDRPLRGATAMRQYPAVVLPVIHPPHDESHCDVDSPASRFEMFRQRLDEVYEGRLELPAVEARSPQQHALHAFADTVRHFEIPRRHFADLAEGRAADVTTTRYTTWSELERHCRQTDGAVALILSCILGVTNSDVERRAAALGSAMRLTSILRDLKRDADFGRIYLPADELDRFGCAKNDLSRGVVNEPLIDLMRFQIDRARALYRAGAEGICWLAGDGSRFTASLVAVEHARILKAIERRHRDVFAHPLHESPARQLTRLPRAWKLARRRHDEPLPRVF
jgi:phytoene synthase